MEFTCKEFLRPAERAAPTKDLDASIVVEVAAVQHYGQTDEDCNGWDQKSCDVRPTAKTDPSFQMTSAHPNKVIPSFIHMNEYTSIILWYLGRKYTLDIQSHGYEALQGYKNEVRRN